MICYYMGDFESAYTYYERTIEITSAQNLDVYQGEKAKIGLVLSKIGMIAESENYFSDYLEYAENDESIYKHLSLAVYNSYKGNSESAIEHMKQFSKQKNYPYWYILFVEIDPLFDNVRGHPEFKKVMSEIEINFWKYHEKMKASLREKGIL